jgi:UDP-glucose 4-epimerase
LTLRVLVTGGAGSLGRAIVSKLSSIPDPPLIRVFDLPSADFSGFTGLPTVELIKGDINDTALLQEAVQGVDAVIHLAAILPPRSEYDRAKTMKINVGGTDVLIKSLTREDRACRIIFSSSTAVYGDTSGEHAPIRSDHPLAPCDVYSESKALAESLIQTSRIPYTILRISGIAVPELVELPDRLPFRRDQRVEFISRDDASLAFVNALSGDCEYATFNIAGGASWQMRGEEYVEKLYGFLGVSKEARYSETYTWLDWYDTADSQRTLRYQEMDLNLFVDRLKKMAHKAGLI